MRLLLLLELVTVALAVGCAFHPDGHSFDGQYCADGTCRAKVGGYGFYQPKWRKWPSAGEPIEPPALEDQLVPTPPIYMPEETAPSTALPEPKRTTPAMKEGARILGDDGVFLPNDTEILDSPPEVDSETALPALPPQLRSDRDGAKPAIEEPDAKPAEEEPNPFDNEDALEPPGTQLERPSAAVTEQKEARAAKPGFELLPPAIERRKITLTPPDSAEVRRQRTVVQTSAVEPEMIKLSEHRESRLLRASAENALERVQLPLPGEVSSSASLRLLPPEDLRADKKLADKKLYVPDTPSERGQALAAQPQSNQTTRDETGAGINRLRIKREAAPPKAEWRPVRNQTLASSDDKRDANPLRTR